MPETTLAERLDAVERALTGEHAASRSENAALDGEGNGEAFEARVEAFEARLEAFEARVEALEAEIDELQAAVQAVRGYVGSIKHVNDEVEDRANAALTKAEAVERTLAATTEFEDTDSTFQHGTDAPKARPSEQLDDSDLRASERSAGHRPVEDSGAGDHRPIENSGAGDHRPIENSGAGDHRPIKDSRAAGHRPVEDSGVPGAYPTDSGSQPEKNSAPSPEGTAASQTGDDKCGPETDPTLFDRLREAL